MPPSLATYGVPTGLQNEWSIPILITGLLKTGNYAVSIKSGLALLFIINTQQLVFSLCTVIKL